MNKKRSTPLLIAAIGIVGVIGAILVFRSNLFRGMPEAAPLATRTEVSVYEFDLSTANRVLPEDVAKEVIYFGRGAGICNEEEYPVPLISLAPQAEELMMQSTLVACGWEKDEVLIGTIQYPDGRTSTQPINVETFGDLYYAELNFIPTLDDPPGIYTLVLAGHRGIVTGAAEFHQPKGPRLYSIDASHIFLYQFFPYESVRLFCYERDQLAAWQEIKVDQNGNQAVTIEADKCAFAAIGETSGEVHIIVQGRDDAMSTINRTCGGLASRLKFDANARVAFINGSGQPIRKGPGYSEEVLKSIPEGTIVWISSRSDVPACADGNLWWWVRTKDGTEGWLAEEQNGVYLLEPVQ